MHQPSAATGVIQVFSLLGLHIEELILRRDRNKRDEANLRCVISGDAARLRLVAARLRTLLFVLEVELNDTAHC